MYAKYTPPLHWLWLFMQSRILKGWLKMVDMFAGSHCTHHTWIFSEALVEVLKRASAGGYLLVVVLKGLQLVQVPYL